MMIPGRTVLALVLAVPTILSGCGETAPTGPDTDNTPPPPLAVNLRTDDPADRITVSSEPASSGAQVRLCLNVRTGSGWWKGVGVNQADPSIAGDRTDGDRCASFTPGNLTLTFWKAKGLGVHTNVGSRSLDLTRYAGHRVDLTWTAD
jgi:hypothetical protein